LLANKTPLSNAKKSSDKKLPLNPLHSDSIDHLMSLIPLEIDIDNDKGSVNQRIAINTLSCKPCSKLFKKN